MLSDCGNRAQVGLLAAQIRCTQPSRSRKAPEKSGSKSASRSATKKGTAASKRAQPKAMAGSRSAAKSQTVPAKSRSAAGSRTATSSPLGTSRSRSTTQGRSQSSMLNPMAWLSTLETTLTSPQARMVMAEALRAVANVLEESQGTDQGQGSGTPEDRDAMSAAGSLGTEIVAAPLEVAAAAIGAAGEVVTSALGGSSGKDRGTGDSRKGRRQSSARKILISGRRLAAQLINRTAPLYEGNVKRPPTKRRPSGYLKSSQRLPAGIESCIG